MTTATKPRTNARKTNPRESRQKPEEILADRIIEMLDQGELPPWNQPWRRSPEQRMCNALSKKPYRGVNIWMTEMTAIMMGYQDHRWMTFKQATELGGTVKKGEKGTQVVFYRILEKENPDNPEKMKRIPVMRLYHVFNADQTEGCRLAEVDATQTLDHHDPIAAAEAIIAAMPNRPEIKHYEVGNHAPHYNPRADRIMVPAMGRYPSVEDWYNTIFHELTHSTGHESRLGRFKDERYTAPDRHAYGAEELVAGMGAAMLGQHAGTGTATIENNASYIKAWRDIISADKGIVVKAARLAQKSTDYIVTAGDAGEEDTAPVSGAPEGN